MDPQTKAATRPVSWHGGDVQLATLPGWIIDIADKELQVRVIDIWRRLPAHVRAALLEDNIL